MMEKEKRYIYLKITWESWDPLDKNNNVSIRIMPKVNTTCAFEALSIHNSFVNKTTNKE